MLFTGVVISLAALNYTVSEEEGEVEVCVSITEGSLERKATVEFATTNDTAGGIQRS